MNEVVHHVSCVYARQPTDPAISAIWLLWFFSNLVGEEGPRGPDFAFGYARQARIQGLFFKDFISVFSILSISDMSFSPRLIRFFSFVAAFLPGFPALGPRK
ncbi:MAG: hypothetical protein U9Q05_04905 [Thermodesulfobacteriota bacterium]|nr:hypothetical protein [Thermodesulfobacteriota bacterium]